MERIREFLRYSYMRKSNKRRKLVLRLWDCQASNYGFELAWNEPTKPLSE